MTVSEKQVQNFICPCLNERGRELKTLMAIDDVLIASLKGETSLPSIRAPRAGK